MQLGKVSHFRSIFKLLWHDVVNLSCDKKTNQTRREMSQNSRCKKYTYIVIEIFDLH